MKKQATITGIKDNNPQGFGGMVSREIRLSVGNDAAKSIDFEKGIDTIATTEAPAIVVDWNRWQYVREILPMRYMEAPNNDKVPLLDTHSRSSVEKIKGSAKNFKTEGTELICKTFLSEIETDIRQKIKEGHIDSVSIGYMTDKEFTIEIPKKASVVIDGTEYRNDYTDDIPLLVRTWWKSHELSLVPIGADETAKFRRQLESSNTKMLEKISELQKEIDSLKEKKREAPDRKRQHEHFKLKNQ